MKQIKTLIINLKTSLHRKTYMQNVLHKYPFLEVSFVDAVDGRIMSETEKQVSFSQHKALSRYGRNLNSGEIGCTLSHRKCYETLLNSKENFSLILEDDISIIRDLTCLPWEQIKATIDVSEPRILFLSGDYWYNKRQDIVPVYDAVGSYAYIINRNAAKIIISHYTLPYNVADDWALYKKQGICLYAVYPYAIDANVDMENLPSDIQQNSWGNRKSNMNISNIIESYKHGIIKRIYSSLGHFEKKTRIVDGHIVE